MNEESVAVGLHPPEWRSSHKRGGACMELVSRNLKERWPLVIEALRATPVAQRRIELVERK